jgi:hypothetical protein
MKGMRFEAVSSIQQTVTRGMKLFLRHLSHCMGDVGIVSKRAGTILSHGINKHFLFIFVGLCPHSHSVYHSWFHP